MEPIRLNGTLRFNNNNNNNNYTPSILLFLRLPSDQERHYHCNEALFWKALTEESHNKHQHT